MSYKLKLALVAAAALALPTIAAAQDPSTRTDITVIGAVSTDNVEQVADTNATNVAEMPVVYEDADTSSNEASEASSANAAANFDHAVEAQ